MKRIKLPSKIVDKIVSWVATLRVRDKGMRGMVEIICAHGIGHPYVFNEPKSPWDIHGCDGCCGKWRK